MAELCEGDFLIKIDGDILFWFRIEKIVEYHDADKVFDRTVIRTLDQNDDPVGFTEKEIDESLLEGNFYIIRRPD